MENDISSVIISEQENLGLDGTSPAEVFSMTFFVPMCSLLIWLAAGGIKMSSRFFQFIEVSALNIILLLGLTLLENHLLLLFGVLVFLIFVVFYAVMLRHIGNPQMKYVLKDINAEAMPEKNINNDFVGGYRGHLLLATSICILAVDFNSFPGRFAKTETFGWSIMDAGVGSFVLVHGLCSSHGRRLVSKQHGMKKCFLSSFPLFLLGLLRLTTTTAVGYHRVVPEYGVHWNFFFTLAFTKMICYTILSKTKIPSGVLAVTTVVFHQLLLYKADVLTMIQIDVRNNFFEENKEGICSLLGFVSLYFFGVQLGRVVWKQGYKLSEYGILLLKLCGIGASGWILMYIFHETVQPVSRRMANLPYCIWVVSLTSLQLAIHLGQELIIIILSRTLRNNYSDFLLWKAINYNGLFYFLLANLLTGLVNITIETVRSSQLQSFIILVTYLAILSVSVIGTYKKSKQLKFW